jgi:hypothetical protein
MCRQPASKGVRGHCWWNAVGFAASRDSGNTFTIPAPPDNVVVSPQSRYDPDSTGGATGFFSPTNIVKQGGYYFVLVNSWSSGLQKTGACLFRTSNVFSPRSWRAWDGLGFTESFESPYTKGNRQAFVCSPVYGGHPQSLVYNPKSKLYLLFEFAPDNRYGPAGLYVSYSSSLARWPRPNLIISAAILQGRFPIGRWRFDYFSVIDPTAADRNFTEVNWSPYLYYVRFDLKRAPLSRTLFRQKLNLTQH